MADVSHTIHTAPSGYAFSVGGRNTCVTSDGTIHHLFSYKNYGNYVSNLYYTVSTDEGATWDTPTSIGASYSTSTASFDAVIAADSSDNLHVAYQRIRDSGGLNNIYYRMRTESTGNWSGETWFSADIIHESSPVIAVDSSDDVHLAWSGPNNGVVGYLDYCKKTSGSWGSNVSVSSVGSSQYIGPKQITCDSNGKVWIAGWISYTNHYGAIIVTDVTGSWVRTELDFGGHNGNGRVIGIAISSDDHIHALYYKNSKAYYKEYVSSWSAAVALDATYDNTSGDIGVDSDDNVHVLLVGLSADSETYTQVKHGLYVDTDTAFTDLTSDAGYSQRQVSMISRQYPIVSTRHPNILTSGYVFTWTYAARATKIFLSDDYEFDVPPKGPANLKSYNGLAKASIKSIKGLAIADIKSINGLE